MKKKYLVIIGIVVLIIGLASFWGYNNYFKQNPEIKQQLSNQFGEDFFTFDDEEVFNKDGKSVDDSAETRDIPSSEATPETIESGTVKKPSTPMNDVVAAKQITQDVISNKYKPRFIHLQNVVLGRLDSLYSAASQEYELSKKAGTLNSSELAKKYIQAAMMLESSLDNQFYSALDEMKAELKANNHPTNIVDVYKSDYEKAKSDMRSQLLAKVRK